MSSFLDDIWKLIGRNEAVQFFTEADFEQSKVPAKPATYAWIYPLKVIDSTNLDEFLIKTRLVLQYDVELWKKRVPPNSVGESGLTARYRIDMNWSALQLDLSYVAAAERIATDYYDLWKHLQRSDQEQLRWKTLKKSLLSASILLPPLYVGKTDKLSRRVNEHLSSNLEGRPTFRSRYVNYVALLNRSIRNGEVNGVSTPIFADDLDKLVLMAVIENEPNTNLDDSGASSKAASTQEGMLGSPVALLEEILKNLARPGYSDR